MNCVIIFNGLHHRIYYNWMDAYLGEGTYPTRKLFSFGKRKKHGSIIL